MSGILYVVATPIGNLEDVTLRALRILRGVSLIAAEDTRRTARLLQHYSISTRTTSLHEHNERSRTPALIARLIEGESIALVSDAGTPLISDPGQHLVAAAREAGVRVESIPGPSAVMAVLAATGFPHSEFTFVGFPPPRSKDRRKWLARVAREPRLVVFFEAPHRIRVTLGELADILGPDHVIAVGRELTKAHEEVVIRPISQLIDWASDPRGEFTLVIPPSGALVMSVICPSSRPAEPPAEADIINEFGQLSKNMAMSRREAVKAVAAKYGLPPNRVYALLTKSRDSGE
jgi:16S rRNA (cytidine1402-2'-O)-methyltransferase